MRYTCRVARGEPAPGDFSIGCFHDALDTAVRHATEVNLAVPQEQMRTYASPAVGGGPVNPKQLPAEILSLMGGPLQAVMNGEEIPDGPAAVLVAVGAIRLAPAQPC